MNIQEKLFQNADHEYRLFSAQSAATVPIERVIGVRVPILRKIAKEIEKSNLRSTFLKDLPHQYHEENLLQAILLENEKDFSSCIDILKVFLPYVDNWAVCDTIRPRVFQKCPDEVLPYVTEWLHSKHVFTCRFGIDMLMTYFLDAAFQPCYLEWVSDIHSDEYYVNMMIAWYFATALAKQWDSTYPYLEQHQLSPWVHKKTVQKACESYRVTDEQKAILRTLLLV